MGRYYSGDIEGKFWFAVQSSDDANFFGCVGEQPPELEYHFDEEHLPLIEKGIKTCKEKLGVAKELLDLFFKHKDSYSDKCFLEAFNMDKEDLRYFLVWYARLDLGTKILDCVKDTKDCYFTAEC